MKIYYYMRIKEENKEKLVFKTQYIYFKYQIIFFNISINIGICLSNIYKILTKKLNFFSTIFLDNILIYI